MLKARGGNEMDPNMIHDSGGIRDKQTSMGGPQYKQTTTRTQTSSI